MSGFRAPQKSDECLLCHVTGHGEPEELLERGFDATKGVQCETCHGPGSDHMRARFRAAAMEDEVPEGQVPPCLKIPRGEIITMPEKEVYYDCHNGKSPSIKAFCYYERVSKILHLDPRKPRTEEEREEMLVRGCGDACECVHECPHEGCGVVPKEAVPDDKN